MQGIGERRYVVPPPYIPALEVQGFTAFFDKGGKEVSLFLVFLILKKLPLVLDSFENR